MTTAVALRPRTFSELFDAAFQLTREHFPPLAVLSALMTLPSLVVTVANLLVFGDPEQFGARGGAPDGYYLTLIASSVVVMCWFFVVFGGMVSAASDAYMGARVDAGESLRRARARAGSLVSANVLAYLRAMGPVILAAIGLGALGAAGMGAAGAPSVGRIVAILVLSIAAMAALVWGLITLLRYTVVSPVVMLEERGAVDAGRRARALSQGSLKRIFGLAFLLFVVSAVLGVGVVLTATAVLRNPIAANVISGLLWIPVYPVIACVVTVLYYDLRIRRDGFDVEYAARQLGDAVGSPAVAH